MHTTRWDSAENVPNARTSTSATKMAVTATIQLKDADDPCSRPTTSCQLFLEGNVLPASPWLLLAEAPPLGHFQPAGVRTGHPNHVNPSTDVLRITTNVPPSSNTLPTPVYVQCLSRWLQGYGQERAPLIEGFIFGFDIGFEEKPKKRHL